MQRTFVLLLMVLSWQLNAPEAQAQTYDGCADENVLAIFFDDGSIK